MIVQTVLWSTLVLLAAFAVLMVREAGSARRHGPRRPPGPYERGDLGRISAPARRRTRPGGTPGAAPGNKGAAPRR